MEALQDLYQTSDFKTEKHVPVIAAPAAIPKGKHVRVDVSVGAEIAHPNTTQHHIVWADLYFHPRGDKYPYQIGRQEFGAHGSSVQGADTSSVYTHHSATFTFKTDKPGTLLASIYCNIHGLWQNSRALEVEQQAAGFEIA